MSRSASCRCGARFCWWVLLEQRRAARSSRCRLCWGRSSDPRSVDTRARLFKMRVKLLYRFVDAGSAKCIEKYVVLLDRRLESAVLGIEFEKRFQSGKHLIPGADEAAMVGRLIQQLVKPEVCDGEGVRVMRIGGSLHVGDGLLRRVPVDGIPAGEDILESKGLKNKSQRVQLIYILRREADHGGLTTGDFDQPLGLQFAKGIADGASRYTKPLGELVFN